IAAPQERDGAIYVKATTVSRQVDRPGRIEGIWHKPLSCTLWIGIAACETGAADADFPCLISGNRQVCRVTDRDNNVLDGPADAGGKTIGRAGAEGDADCGLCRAIGIDEQAARSRPAANQGSRTDLAPDNDNPQIWQIGGW